MITIGFKDTEYSMILDLVDQRLESLIDSPVDEYVICDINEWISVLHTLGEHDLAMEYESAVDDLQNELNDCDK